MDPTTSPHYEQALKSMEKFHGNLSVLAKLYKILRDTNSNLDTVTKLLNSDSILAANIVRISNSAYYGIGVRCKDIKTALQKVGLDKVLRLVGIAMSKQVFMKDLKAYGISADDYWLHSFLCATICEKMASRLGYDVDSTYLSGLLHAIGRIVINEYLNEENNEIFWDSTLPHDLWEEATTGLKYTDVGAELLKRWKFDNEIIKIVKNHLDPISMPKDNSLALLNYVVNWSRENNYSLTDNWEILEDHPFLELSESTNEQLLEDLKASLIEVQEIHECLRKE